jgi:hypothetical protein
MRHCWSFVLVLTAVGVPGCGGSTGTIKGKVSYNGTLLKGGKVTFYCADGKSVLTAIREDGTYLLEKLPLGKAKICVDTTDLNPATRRAYTYAPPPGAKKDLPGAKPSPGVEAYVAIPPKYASPETTDLFVEVTGGSRKHDIELK